ncbi:MAG: 30S ribosomal protein S12 methylthiotransferase RimO [Prevotellaceae bacterium]|jgi:ribosomal protein S12 methylthiotransferase|nr:30S ribosomal protein S12 methylthiotransferase RimO [Prevotellaceae bacterium]
MKNHIDFITLGCSKNLVDSEKVIRQLEAKGYTVAHDSDNPQGEIAIINTCGFIGDAKEESINMILQFAEKKKRKKLHKLLVMGCLSERYKDDLQKEIPEVDKFYGKFDFEALINDLIVETQCIASLQNTHPDWLDRTLTTPPHYAYLKISEGCNRTCAYCAIPIITGKHISRPMEDLEEEVKRLVAEGVKEFQLIAQDLSYYGLDLYKRLALPELVERLARIEGVEWLRLHYAYPAHFPYELLRVIRETPNVCKYLDIALQHISDNQLKLMRRHITKAETIELIERIRREVPGIHLRTTLMVGHPGETEQDFEELKDFVRWAKFERMGAFTYSNEDDTYSDKHYKDDIPLEVKQARLDELMAIQQEISAEINQQKIGKILKVIIDREDNDYYYGRTEFDSPEVDPEVLIDKKTERYCGLDPQSPEQYAIPCQSRNDLFVGQFYDVEITGADDFDLFGKIKES